MSTFYGGPWNDGHPEAVRAFLESRDGPLPFTPAIDSFPTARDLDRTIPRHFPLSIPSDPLPGFPIHTGRRR